MSAKSSTKHPLSERHFSQIVCRDSNLAHRMRSVWAVTWRPGDQTSHFLGKLFRPLGAATMMVQVSYHRPGERPGIGLFGVTAQIDPSTAHVYYSELRLRHEFHFVPRPGARHTVLDPERNESWVQLALEVDRARKKVVERNFPLPAVPNMPLIFGGFGALEHAEATLCETPALRRLAVGGSDLQWQGTSLDQLSAYSAEVAAAKDAVFAAWPADVQLAKLKDAWRANVINPSDPLNTTGMWLVPHTFLKSVYNVPRHFEYFGGLVGTPVFNPARKMGAKMAANPAIEVAKAAGLDLVALLGAASGLSDDDPRYKEIEEQLIALLPGYRQTLGASAEISDQELLGALCEPDKEVQIEPAPQHRPDVDPIPLMREKLRPEISTACTDADILAAFRNPHEPLLASGLATIQCLRRDVRVPLEDSMCFTPEVLGVEKVSASFWYDLPQPAAAKRKGRRHAQSAV